MRHGLTLGEAARVVPRRSAGSTSSCASSPMEGYDPTRAPGFGWPLGERAWVNPSPNLASPGAARIYPGTVLLEGTELSEGRGTTRPLELFGAPGLDVPRLLAVDGAPRRRSGCAAAASGRASSCRRSTSTWASCAPASSSTSTTAAYRHDAFRPYRLVALFLKALRAWRPDYALWRDFVYEYESGRLPIDVINGGPALREWVDDDAATPADLDALLVPDERAWDDERRALLMYPESTRP